MQTNENLTDGGHIYLRCSNCEAILADIWRTRPYEQEVWGVKATCPFCPAKPNGKPEMSGRIEIQGGISPGSYGTPNPDNANDDIPSTQMDYSDFDEEGDIILYMKKASENAKPVF